MTKFNPFTEKEVVREWICHIESKDNYLYEKEIYPCVSRWLNSRTGPLLDVGCGAGHLASITHRHQIEYYGIDPSLELIKYAKDHFGKYHAFASLGSAEHVPFGGNSFSSALSVNVFMHIADLRPALYEIARVLYPGSSFLCITSNPFENEQWQRLYYNKKMLADGGIVGSITTSAGVLNKNVFYPHTYSEWLRASSEAGFSFSIRESNLGKKTDTSTYLFSAFELQMLKENE